MSLTKEEVKKVAFLARLEFKDEEIEKFQGQLNDILSYVDKLSEVNVDGIEPLSHAIDLKNSFRDDIAEKCISNELALKNAPKKEDGTFIVPKIV